MNSIAKFFTSSPGKKYLMAVTGLALFLFLIAHLLGNLQLLLPSGVLFNKYAYHLESLKPLVVLAEIGLLILVAIHIGVGLAVWSAARQARPQGYEASIRTKGGDSHLNLSSNNMLVLGIVILVFIVLHVWQFKYGPGLKQGYQVQVEKNAEFVRDLYKLVVLTFANVWWMLFYIGCMLFIGYHLRHGIWSAFQSLGAMPGRYSRSLYFGGAVLGFLIAIGFLLLPLWVFLAYNVFKIIPHY